MKRQTSGKSIVVAKCAQTIDGKIATVSRHSKWITSVQTRLFSRKQRKNFDAILVGINTVIQDDPALEVAGLHKKIKKVVLDSSLKLPISSKLVKKYSRDTVVFCLGDVSNIKVKTLESFGVEVVRVPKNVRVIKIKWVLKQLEKRNITKVLIEGGSKVIGSALKEKCVDQLHIYMAPKIIGDQNALSSIDGLNIVNISKTIKLKFSQIQSLNQDLFIKADVYRNR